MRRVALVLVLILLVLELIPLMLWGGGGVGDCCGLELVRLMIPMVMPADAAAASAHIL